MADHELAAKVKSSEGKKMTLELLPDTTVLDHLSSSAFDFNLVDQLLDLCNRIKDAHPSKPSSDLRLRVKNQGLNALRVMKYMTKIVSSEV